MKSETVKENRKAKLEGAIDWAGVARLILISRGIDDLEENELAPQRKVLYQFSARGHELAQTLLACFLTHPHDGISAYYRSRPLLLALGVSVEDALAGPMALSGGYSGGRDIGVVSNFPNPGGPTVLPMAGDVGSQYTPAVGWAQAIVYRRHELGEQDYGQAMAVAMGGDGSVATNGFWAALNVSTSLQLPLLFFIEDNGFGLSVPSSLQTPGGDIAANLKSFGNLRVGSCDGTEPVEAAHEIDRMVRHVRSGAGPALLRLRVPRLCGHSLQDTQAYKDPEMVERERASDPLARLRRHLVPQTLTERDWERLEEEARREVATSAEKAMGRPQPDPASVRRHVYCEVGPDGTPELQQAGGLAAEGHALPATSGRPKPESTRINLIEAVRLTLERELEVNPKLVIFGEDVGVKGGVHAATKGLQEKFGPRRVFDTSLSEEGIIGRAVGMSLAGLMPAAEIQFRKYADPATEQINNCGTLRWRTNNRFAAPLVVRMPGGFSKCGDPWHSVSGEVLWSHAVGWKLAFPSNAEDAVGLLRTALRGNDPTIFFEHRALLDAASARRPYPGHDYALPFGRAQVVQSGDELTVVTWGAMVERCRQAAGESGVSAEIIDLRTIQPWDSESVILSVGKTKRCLIVHEDALTSGFGAEIAATLVKEAFFDLDAPIERLAVPDIPIPYSLTLLRETVPEVARIADAMRALIEF